MESFPGYKTKYHAFSDIWTISNREWRHHIWYNPGKNSKIVTEKVGYHQNEIMLFAGGLSLLLLLIILDEILDWQAGEIIGFSFLAVWAFDREVYPLFNRKQYRELEAAHAQFKAALPEVPSPPHMHKP